MSSSSRSFEAHHPAAMPPREARTQRPCPVCGNSSRAACTVWCAVPEFEVLRCSQCDVRFIDRKIEKNPGFSEDSAAEPDDLYFAKAAEDFRHMERKLKAKGLLKGTPSLLDVGCGAGAFLQKAQAKGWEVAGLELSPSIASFARGHYGLRVDHASIEAGTPFPAGSFDVITLFGVIEHLANPRAAIEECARLLRRGGVLVLQTPSEDGLLRRVGGLLYRLGGKSLNFHVRQLYQTDGGHSVCFNRRSMRKLLADQGLGVFAFENSTYGFKVLLPRFRQMPLHRRIIQGLGTLLLFYSDRLFGGGNHFTVYAQKP